MGLSVLKKLQIQGLQAQALNQASVTKPLARLATVLGLVKPTDQPSSFDGLFNVSSCVTNALKPQQRLLRCRNDFLRPPSFPIDLHLGASTEGEALASWEL